MFEIPPLARTLSVLPTEKKFGGSETQCFRLDDSLSCSESVGTALQQNAEIAIVSSQPW